MTSEALSELRFCCLVTLRTLEPKMLWSRGIGIATIVDMEVLCSPCSISLGQEPKPVCLTSEPAGEAASLQPLGPYTLLSVGHVIQQIPKPNAKS